MDVYSAVNNLKKIDLQNHVLKAKGVFAEAFELGGEKTETQLAMERWQRDERQGLLSEQPAAAHRRGSEEAAGGGEGGGCSMARHAQQQGGAGEAGGGGGGGGGRGGILGGGDIMTGEGEPWGGLSVDAREEVEAEEEEASEADKVIHMQRERLKQLQREKERAEVAARRAQAALEERQALAEAEREQSREAAMPMTAPRGEVRVDYDAMHRAGSEIVQRVRARRGMVAGALAVVMVLLLNATQSGLASAKRAAEVGGERGVDELIERGQLEQLVTELLNDEESLVGTKEGAKKDSKVMEKHIKSVSSLLGKLHAEHVRTKDDVHDKLRKENEKLVKELEKLNAQVKNSLNGLHETRGMPPVATTPPPP